MITADGAKRYRATCEAEARAAAASGDYEVWLRAIGKISGLDHVLSDEEALPASASDRIPFPAFG